MLWYLLYPLRGTTEAPVLAPTHPLRKAFTRYAKWAARHVKIVLPLSGAAIFIFLYLFPYLYTTDAANITNGVSHLPHHVWTDAQPLGERPGLEPDVIMRSIWVHGSYMKALDRRVLLGALELQDEILGPTTNFNPRQPHGFRALPGDPEADLDRRQRDAFHITNGLTNQSWFFHSPLQYWAGSADNILADPDIIATVNERKTQSTTVNTTLRHSIVFSGKRFQERRLLAADALVITLIHLRDSPVGRQWVRKAEAQADAAGRDGKWKVIPPDGKSASHQLYKFQFRPMSWSDWGLLTIAYSLMTSFLVFRMSKLRAVKSRVGLMVTVLVQIAASIVSSFTVCAIVKIDLSRVPHYAYPLVIFAISLENSFRLINAVIMTSSTISNSDRIGEAFGATAHIAIANRVQNFLILLGLSRITASGVSAFCTFAALATVFDFVYLATFFLSVLSVDVRQRELYELEKAASLKRVKSSATGPPMHQPWMDGIYQLRLGETAVSTRVAGTIVLIGFVLIAQAHFSPEGGRQWLDRLVSVSRGDFHETAKSPLLIDIHQARSPTSWLRLQDHESAREVIKVIKPWAHSYVARVYDPVVFVLAGADRTPDIPEPIFLPAVYDFLHHQIPRFVVWLLTMLAALRLFTNHLVRDQSRNGGGPEHPDDEPLLSVHSLSQGHTLDVALLAASTGGRLASVGLDRAVQVWDVRSGTRSRVESDPEVPLENPFPVLSMAIDDQSRWLALVSWQRVFLWSIEEQRWKWTRNIDLARHRPQAVFFVTKRPGAVPSLLLVRRNGLGLEMQIEAEESREFTICKTPLIWAVSFSEKGNAQQQFPPISILTASRKNCIHLVRQRDNEWLSTEVKLEGEREARDIHCLLPVPALSMYLIGRSQSVDLVDLDSSTIVHTFHTEAMQPRSLKHIFISQSGHPYLASLTLSYTSSATGDLVIHTYLPDAESDSIPPPSPVEPAVCIPPSTWNHLKESTRRVTNPGVWEALPSGSIVGVRRKQQTRPSSPASSSSASASSSSSSSTLSSAAAALLQRPRLRLRRRPASPPSPNLSRATNITNTTTNRALPSPEWEAWVLNRPDTKGDFETRPLDGGSSEEDENPELGSPERAPAAAITTRTTTATATAGHPGDYGSSDSTGGIGTRRHNLLISELGPMVRLGTMSVAVGFGNVVKVVSVGHEHFDKSQEIRLGLGLGMGMGMGMGMALGVEGFKVMNVGVRRKKGSGASVRSGGGRGGGGGAGAGAGGG